MGISILDIFKHVNNYENIEVKVIKEPTTTRNDIFMLDDCKNIEVSEISPYTRNLITAHNISQYNRKIFKIELLPDIKLTLDYLLEEVIA